MRSMGPRNSHLKKATLLATCLAVFSIMSLPAPILAGTVYSNGTASIDWSTLNITFTFNPAGAPLSGGAGIPRAFSEAQVQLNGDQTDFGLADYSDGSLPTSSSASLSDLNGSLVQAFAQTTTSAIPGTTTGLFASLTQTLIGPATSGLPNGVSNQAQATFYDYGFTAPSNGLFTASVAYALTNPLSSNDPLGLVASDVAAGLYLYGYDIYGNPLNKPFATALAELTDSLVGSGTGSGIASSSGFLTLSVNLIGGNLYDFGGEVTATGSASALPVPAPVLLLASGLVGLCALKRSGRMP